MNLIEEQDFAYYECLQAEREKEKEVARIQALLEEKKRFEAAIECEALQKEKEKEKEKEKPVDLDLVRSKRIEALSKRSLNS
jgi:hypothetical protein